MKKGTVKFFNNAKGYGFITAEETGKDYFIHANNLDGLKIKEGDAVEFETRASKKGEEAFNVKKLK